LAVVSGTRSFSSTILNKSEHPVLDSEAESRKNRHGGLEAGAMVWLTNRTSMGAISCISTSSLLGWGECTAGPDFRNGNVEFV
jgi:hypothetical protein